MKRTTIFLLLSVFLLSACGRAAAEEVATPTSQVEEMPEITPVIADPFLNECKNCHTDKQSLIDTARPVEVIEKESTGTG